MREKLISILYENQSPYMDWEPSAEDMVGHILSRLRCDRCKHWRDTGWPISNHYCVKLEKGSDAVKMYGDYGHDATILTKPDFFCAEWEPKQ